MKTWAMTFDYDRNTAVITLQYSEELRNSYGLPAVERIDPLSIKTRFHTYDLRKFAYFSAYDEGIFFHTLFRVKMPKVMRAVALCQTTATGFSCVLVDEELIQKRRRDHNGRRQLLFLDPMAIQAMPKEIDRQRLQAEFEEVLQGELVF